MIIPCGGVCGKRIFARSSVKNKTAFNRYASKKTAPTEIPPARKRLFNAELVFLDDEVSADGAEAVLRFSVTNDDEVAAECTRKCATDRTANGVEIC